jgi:hypothetical protein
VSRYDKYDPRVGGFRAKLNAAWNSTSGPAGVTDLNRVLVVGINSSGRVVKATTVAECVGVLVLTGPKAAGDPVDVMTAGEIVELDGADIQGGTAASAGDKLWFDSTASRLTKTAPSAGTMGFYVGQLVEANRLIVRCGFYGGTDA